MKPLDLTRFDLNLLVVLEALWAQRHVGRAAQHLHLSQSATSHALSRLRTAFDDQLFIRNPRGMAPTPLAIELMPRVAAVLESVRLVASPRGPFDPARLQATLRIAATDHAVLTVIAPAGENSGCGAGGGAETRAGGWRVGDAPTGRRRDRPGVGFGFVCASAATL